MPSEINAEARVLSLNGVHNFRDFGGYPVVGGGRVKSGVLWRSGQHHAASDSDLAVIGGLGLARVYDLRSKHERGAQPCRRPEGFAAEVHFIDYGMQAELAPHIAASAVPDAGPETVRSNMQHSYAGMAFRPYLVELMQRLFVNLAADGAPSLIHCMAGKDRTGIVAAMLHHALGVHPDDIVADYLLTNTVGDPAARIAAGLRAAGDYMSNLDEASLKVMMGVEPAYLETALAAVRERYGSIDAYQADVLGVDAALREQLTARLIEM